MKATENNLQTSYFMDILLFLSYYYYYECYFSHRNPSLIIILFMTS